MDEDSPWGDVPSSSRPSTSHTDHGNTAPPPSEGDAMIGDHKATAASNEDKSSNAPTKKTPRGARTTRKFGTQSTTLEILDDSMGPLGPLGSTESPPVPPQKEDVLSSPIATNKNEILGRSSTKSSLRGLLDSVNLNDDDDDDNDKSIIKPREPPPVKPANFDINMKRNIPPGISIEQAARPSFEVSIGDPHKVGDLTSSHTVYQVRTKTSSKAYRQAEFEAARRYRDFLWLYNQLHSNNPGVIVPPPPEKQAVGRFDQNFVESRRAALERMMTKITSHPILQQDGDLKTFLESENFTVDIKHKEKKEFGISESKGGVLSSIGLSGSTNTKFIEHDDWFHDRRIYLDALENQLKALLKAIDAVISQRKALSESCGEFSSSLHALASVELSPQLSSPLDGLSDVQLRIRELYDRQAQQDVLTFGIIIDEYIRLIGSVKQSFTQRQKAFYSWHAAETSLIKLKSSHDKLLRAGRTQQDRIVQMQADVGDSERRVHQARLLFDDMGRLMRNELDRFEKEKVEDFKSGIETYLESSIEAQKELIEIWETYLMQLDHEEQDDVKHDDNLTIVTSSSTTQVNDDSHENNNEEGFVTAIENS